MDITPDQVRAARALLRIDQSDLARRARVSVTTVKRLEAATGLDTVAPTSLAGIRAALEAAGAEFITNGVRKREEPNDDAERLFQELRAVTRQHARFFKTQDILTDADLYDENGIPA